MSLSMSESSISQSSAPTDDTHHHVPNRHARSFWRRTVSRLPGSIRPVGGGGPDRQKVFGAQHTFASPASVAAKFSYSKHQATSPASSSPETTHRKSLKTRDQLVDQTSDAWGEIPGSTLKATPASPHKLTTFSGSSSQLGSPRRHGSGRAASTPVMDSADLVAEDEIRSLNAKLLRHAKFQSLLSAPTLDLPALRKLAWSGIPDDLRPLCWKLLMGYLPCPADRRDTVLARKRSEYLETVVQSLSESKDVAQDKALMHQIHIDVLRTRPTDIYAHPKIQAALGRVLYCWSMRHPASGYVQGINDLLSPFFTVYIAPHLEENNNEMDQLSEEVLVGVEADSFWCLTKLIDGIQDNYTYAQPGIQKLVSRLKDLIQRIDAPLSAHLVQENVEFIQFAFRWMNCLLMREVRHHVTIRMWDAYLSEEGDLNDFHVYVCAAFLVRWSKDIQTKDFPEIMLFLQSPPTKDWTEKDTELLLSEAFMWKSLFHNSPNHFTK